MSEETVIKARGLTRTYLQGKVEVPALRGVDLDVKRGELLTLSGPSGSGKSTLLNLLGVLDQPTSGSIEIAGRALGALSRREAALFRLGHIGFVFQAYNLLPVLSAYENAEFVLLQRGVEKAEREALVMPLLERVGLKGMEGRRPHELSGGQQQRVAVVRAIAARPEFVLADEPTANLDSVTSNALLDLFTELNRDEGLTFVLASHDEEVIRRASRSIHLKDGRIDAEVRAAA